MLAARQKNKTLKINTLMENLKKPEWRDVSSFMETLKDEPNSEQIFKNIAEKREKKITSGPI